MAKMSRRAMLYVTSASVATVAGVTAFSGTQLHNASADAPTTPEPTTSSSVTAYIADAKSGKISLLFGENEVVITNHALVQQIIGLAK